jgi:hypothetical protein
MLHHDAANVDPYIFHIIPLYVCHIAWVESCLVTWRVNLCSMPLSDIHFDWSIFSLVSVWATFVMHDTGPGRQSFSQIDCQIYIENYMVIISGTTGRCSLSTLRRHYIFAGRALSFCTMPVVQYSKKRTSSFWIQDLFLSLDVTAGRHRDGSNRKFCSQSLDPLCSAQGAENR